MISDILDEWRRVGLVLCLADTDRDRDYWETRARIPLPHPSRLVPIYDELAAIDFCRRHRSPPSGERAPGAPVVALAEKRADLPDFTPAPAAHAFTGEREPAAFSRGGGG